MCHSLGKFIIGNIHVIKFAVKYFCLSGSVYKCCNIELLTYVAFALCPICLQVILHSHTMHFTQACTCIKQGLAIQLSTYQGSKLRSPSVLLLINFPIVRKHQASKEELVFTLLCFLLSFKIYQSYNYLGSERFVYTRQAISKQSFAWLYTHYAASYATLRNEVYASLCPAHAWY